MYIDCVNLSYPLAVAHWFSVLQSCLFCASSWYRRKQFSLYRLSHNPIRFFSQVLYYPVLSLSLVPSSIDIHCSSQSPPSLRSLSVPLDHSAERKQRKSFVIKANH